MAWLIGCVCSVSSHACSPVKRLFCLAIGAIWLSRDQSVLMTWLHKNGVCVDIYRRNENQVPKFSGAGQHACRQLARALENQPERETLLFALTGENVAANSVRNGVERLLLAWYECHFPSLRPPPFRPAPRHATFRLLVANNISIDDFEQKVAGLTAALEFVTGREGSHRYPHVIESHLASMARAIAFTPGAGSISCYYAPGVRPNRADPFRCSCLFWPSHSASSSSSTAPTDSRRGTSRRGSSSTSSSYTSSRLAFLRARRFFSASTCRCRSTCTPSCLVNLTAYSRPAKSFLARSTLSSIVTCPRRFQQGACRRRHVLSRGRGTRPLSMRLRPPPVVPATRRAHAIEGSGGARTRKRSQPRQLVILNEMKRTALPLSGVTQMPPLPKQTKGVRVKSPSSDAVCHRPGGRHCTRGDGQEHTIAKTFK